MPQSDGATAQAQEKASEVAGQAKEQAQQKAGQAKDQLRTQVDQRSTQAGEQVNQQAGDIRTVAQQLREQGKDKPAQLAEQAADRAERVGSYLQESDADRILGDVEDFARQKPWAVVAGGLALGFAASRFLKASQSERYQSRVGQGPSGPGYGQGTSAGYGTGRPASQAGNTTIPAATGTGLPANELSTGVGVSGDRGDTAPPTAHPAAPVSGGF